LLTFLFANPFQAFDIYLVDGRTLRVTHPESVSVYNGGMGLWLLQRSGQVEFLEGAAVTSLRSVDPSEFIREEE
jgi:hypothetical protein